MNLRKLDLNLLLVFDAIYADRSVTNAAHKLGMTQPAVSNALKRLREHLGDALFERSGQGVEPTQEARRLAPVIRSALEDIERTLSLGEDFDPATSKREFGMIVPDAIETIIMQPLVTLALEKMPGIRYAMRPLDLDSLSRSVVSKDVELAFFVAPIHEPHVSSVFLMSESSCVIARADHPVFGERDAITEDEFFTCGFVALPAEMRRITHLERESRARGRSRRIVCTAKRLWSIPFMVASTDLIGALPLSMAQSIAPKLNLKIFDLPLNAPPDNWYMIWHSDYDHDPAHRWLRETIRAVAARR